MSESSERLLVLGAGTMGAQIAQQAALGGIEVVLADSIHGQLDRAVAGNREILERRVAKGKLDSAVAEAALGRVTISDDLAAAAAGCEWAIEAIFEDLGAKRGAFTELDRHLPEAAGIASNSSNIVISRLADATTRPDRCCNMHFFHPVLVMELCEVARGPQTSDETMRRAVSWCRRMGRRPVVVEKEIDGFIVNRVLGAASQEAFSLLTDGIASVADIDTAARAGLNWPMGPFELVDFSGVDVVLGVRRDRRTRDGERGGEPTLRLLESMVAAGRLGRKAGRGFYDYSTKPPTPLPLPET
jgi:3-hydroxybutyryl-CoA dehydrogenase